MNSYGVLQLVIYLVVLLALAKPLGAYMARVFENRPIGLDRVLGPIERLIYRLCFAVIGAADPGEKLRLSVDQSGENCRFSISRPAALRSPAAPTAAPRSP